MQVLCLGLVCSVLRFLYISYIREPWGVIPFELIQGVTHSAVWAASCSYIAHNTPPELRVSAQGVLSFIHNGAGRACGTIFGGVFSTYYGRYSHCGIHPFFIRTHPLISLLKAQRQCCADTDSPAFSFWSVSSWSVFTTAAKD